jgi:hypothetical protein
MMQELRRRMGLLHRDESGQSLVFVALCLLMMFMFVCVTVDVGDFVADKIDVQNDADAMAISTAVWQARGLNLVQTLNIAKNLAHVHYMLELMELIFWLAQLRLDQAWCAGFGCGPLYEGLTWEYDDLGDELATLTRIQMYIAGHPPFRERGSTENFIALSIPFVDTANNSGSFHPTSVAVNQRAARGPVYDSFLKMEFRRRDNFWKIFCEWQDVECDSWFLDLIGDAIDVDFDWALQTEDYIDEQFTVGFAIRTMGDAPLYRSIFQPRSLIGPLFGGSMPLFERDVHMAIAQAKPFKPDVYTLDPGDARNGVAANLLGLPFASVWTPTPDANNEAFWDVKLTPVTVMDDLSRPLVPLMTH